jgi:hypothetical protein
VILYSLPDWQPLQSIALPTLNLVGMDANWNANIAVLLYAQWDSNSYQTYAQVLDMTKWGLSPATPLINEYMPVGITMLNARTAVVAIWDNNIGNTEVLQLWLDAATGPTIVSQLSVPYALDWIVAQPNSPFVYAAALHYPSFYNVIQISVAADGASMTAEAVLQRPHESGRRMRRVKPALVQS